MTDSRPMDQKKSVPLDALLQAVSLGNVEPEVLSSVAVRLARLETQLSEAERDKVLAAVGGFSLKELSRGIVQALNPTADRTPQEAEAALRDAVKPLSSPDLRKLVLELRAQKEQVIDTAPRTACWRPASPRPPASAPSPWCRASRPSSRSTATRSPPCRSSTTGPPGPRYGFEDLKALADTLQAPPHLWTEGQLWQAYAALDK